MKYLFNIFFSNKLRSIKMLIVILLLFIIPTSCNIIYSKENYIKDFTLFIDKVKLNSPTYNKADWINSDLLFEKFSVEQYEKFKPELSESDKETIGKLKGTYNVYKFKKEAKEALEKTKDLIYQAKGVLEEAIDTLKK